MEKPRMGAEKNQNVSLPQHDSDMASLKVEKLRIGAEKHQIVSERNNQPER
jgi:hypothetical protein